MRRFLFKIFWFIFIFLLFLVIAVFLPATPKASKSLIFSNLLKDSLMKNVESPRIIFIGGSNLSFGINSQMIKDSLNINPINTGVHASTGLIYMMSNSEEFIKEGDIIILVPEYQQFYGEFAYGSEGEELTRTIFDVNLIKISLLGIKQLINVFKILPNYFLSKFKINEYFDIIEDNIYGVHSFNKYGDAFKHWGLKKQAFKPYGIMGDSLNKEIFKAINEYQIEIEKKKAMLLISFPGYQDLSYLNAKDNIKKIENELKREGFKTLGCSERYMIPDSLMFNTPYHLSKKGVDYRTNLLIFDIRKSIKENKSR